jgi:hypothetical protein
MDNKLTPLRLSRRTLVQAGVLLALAPIAQSSQAQIAISTGINRSGRLRALSQRCAKGYAQIHLNVMPERSREVISTAQRIMAANIEELLRSTPPKEIAAQLTAVQNEVAKLNSLCSVPPTKDGVLAVSQQSNLVLAAANKVTLSYEALGKSGNSKLVNIAGRQRLLSQRLAKNFFLFASGFETKAVRDEIEADRAEFKTALGTLQNAPISTANIRNELALAQSQWVFYEGALTQRPEAENMRTVATTSERLLEVMNNLTELYDAALKDVLGQA